MENKQSNDTVLDDNQKDVSRVKIIDCPNCEESVPLSIYCLKCGFPMFDLMKEHMNEESVDGKDVKLEGLLDEGVDSTKDRTGELEFRMEPADLDAEDLENKDVNSEEERELSLGEEEELLGVDGVLEITEPEKGSSEKIESKSLERLDISSHDLDENEVKTPMTEGKVVKLKRGFDPDEAIQSLMRNLANSINLKLWSVGQLLDEKISEENFQRLHNGYDARYHQLMDQRNERLEQARDVKSLEEGLERAYICKGELEVRKSLNDLFEGEYEAKAPAFEWEIAHCEIQLENRKGEIAFVESLSIVVPSDKLLEMAETAKSYLERMQSSEGLLELINNTYARLKTSIEEIVGFLEANE
jgi:hypothetical protein